MNSEKDQTIAKLLNESRDMIERFESLLSPDPVVRARISTEGPAPEDDSGLEPAADAYFDLFVDEEAATAIAEFRPPAGGGKPLDLDLIEEALVLRGVVYGVLWDEIRQALDDCNLERTLRSGVVIARGRPASPGIPGHIRLRENLSPDPRRVAEERAAIDFKQITPFVMVDQGEVVADRIPEVPGVPGTDILGRPVPFVTEVRPSLEPGENIVETPEGFTAGISGRLVVASSTFSVSPVLELKNGVDYRTGHIHFRGQVILLGPVAAGFSVEAGGALVCRDTLDASTVKVGGDLEAPGGVIGHGPGRLDVGGSVAAKFLEHCYLVADGSVSAVTCVLNSVVKTRGKLTLGDRGILAGGHVQTRDGVDVFQISTATGPRTEIVVGLDFRGMDRILWLKNRIQELQGQLKKIDAALPYGGNRIPDLMVAAKKLRVEIVQLAETARTQLMELDQNEAATVVVRGSVFPGTQIEICHVPFLVNQKMTAVRFFLEKRKGLVSCEPLGGGSPKTATPSAPGLKKH